MTDPHTSLTRRRVLSGAALVAATAGSARAGTAEGDFRHEIVRSESDWRSRLSDAEFRILRLGETEEKFISPLVENTEPGSYCCRGCDLTVYDQQWQVYPDKGWVFFRHAAPQSVLTAIDGNPYIGSTDVREFTLIEVHCRRCGSHFGHLLTVDGETLHCINGTALRFRPASA